MRDAFAPLGVVPKVRRAPRDRAVVQLGIVMKLMHGGRTYGQAAERMPAALRAVGRNDLADEWSRSRDPAKKMKDFVRRQYGVGRVDKRHVCTGKLHECFHRRMKPNGEVSVMRPLVLARVFPEGAPRTGAFTAKRAPLYLPLKQQIDVAFTSFGSKRRPVAPSTQASCSRKPSGTFAAPRRATLRVADHSSKPCDDSRLVTYRRARPGGSLAPPRPGRPMARIDKMDDVTQNDELEGVLDEIERSIADHRRGFVPYVIPSEVFLQYPSSDVVKPASTPRPPKLSGVFAQDFSLMKLAYHSAVRYRDRFLPDLARFRKRRNPMDGAWEKLKKSHALMISAGVDEPHSWCMFRLRMLAKSRAENKPRSLSIFGVYSKKALTDPKILEMYHDEKDRLCARRDVATHSLAELVSLWNKAREAVIEARPATRDEAVHVARRVLSLGTYNRLVDAAKREQVAYRSEMRRRASAGEWIWATLG